MSNARIYNALETIISEPKPFVVIASTPNGDRFATKMRHEGVSEADGLEVEGSQITLYVSTTKQQENGATIDITPSKWEFTLSEYPHPETGEVINLKWLRVKR